MPRQKVVVVWKGLPAALTWNDATRDQIVMRCTSRVPFCLVDSDFQQIIFLTKRIVDFMCTQRVLFVYKFLLLPFFFLASRTFNGSSRKSNTQWWRRIGTGTNKYGRGAFISSFIRCCLISIVLLFPYTIRYMHAGTVKSFHYPSPYRWDSKGNATVECTIQVEFKGQQPSSSHWTALLFQVHYTMLLLMRKRGNRDLLFKWLLKLGHDGQTDAARSRPFFVDQHQI